MGSFNGLGKAPTFERGKYLPGGFKGNLQCKRTIEKDTRRSGKAFIVEFVVQTTNMPDEVPVGAKRTWFQKMVDMDVAFPAIKEWAIAMAGYTTDQKKEVEEELEEGLDDLMNHAVENPAENDFTDVVVYCETEQVTTQAGGDFTRHTWAPVSGD